MKTLQDVRDVVAEVSLGEGQRFRVDYFAGSMVIYVQHQFWRADSMTGSYGWGKGRKWHLSPHATESEIVLTCLKAAITNAAHEVREAFEYRGARLFQPHQDVNALVEACQTSDVREAVS